MTITADYQAELRNLTVGAGTSYQFSAAPAGFGTPTPRSSDQYRGDQAGDVAAADIPARRVLTFALNIDADTPAECWQAVQALKAAWSPSPVDVELGVRFPGFPSSDGILRYYGRPRGADVDLSLLSRSHADALATFEALDPFGYGPEETVPLAGGATPITNPGDAVTDRYTLELVRSGAASSFSNADDDEPGLSLVAGSETLSLDGRARTIRTTSADAYGLLSPGSGWPILVAGTNTITLAGATGTLVYRPAFG